MTDPQSENNQPTNETDQQASNTENEATKNHKFSLFDQTFLAAIRSSSSRIFLLSWGTTLVITFLAFGTSYLKASNWLVRGKALSQNSYSCVKEQFRGVLEAYTPESDQLTNSADTVLEEAQHTALIKRKALNTQKLALLGQQSNLKAEISRLNEQIGASQIESQQSEARTQSSNEDSEGVGGQVSSQTVASESTDDLNAAIAEQQTELRAVESSIAQTDRELTQLESVLRSLGIPRISFAEIIRLSEQNETIQQRIYVHYDIIRSYYGIHQAGSVGAAISLLLGSVVLIFITGDIWDGKIKENPELVFPLILFGGTYILFLNLPAVLSAEKIYQANLTQYIGYVNLEQEICTVLATERFVGDPNQPDTIKEIQFNRLLHSVEKRMQDLNSITMTSNIEAIERFRFNLDSLNYPRKDEETIDN